MILKHARNNAEGIPIENTFEALDERSGETIGSCIISMRKNETLYPLRPIRIFMDIEGDPAPDALLGAAVARAFELAKGLRKPCRIFTQVRPDDVRRMDSLKVFGFTDTDGLVRMQCDLPYQTDADLPGGWTLVKDKLEDPLEQQYFLERYNLLYSEDRDLEWLNDLHRKEGFSRLLLISHKGMVCECLIWLENGAGMIGWIQTAKVWRCKHAATAMLQHVCNEFSNLGISKVCCDIQVRIPLILKLFESFGFYQSELLARYPGIDIDPQ